MVRRQWGSLLRHELMEVLDGATVMGGTATRQSAVLEQNHQEERAVLL